VPVTEEPHHRVVFENAEFRILDVNVPAGATTDMHTHAHDIATVSMNAGTDTRAQVSGEDWQVRPPRPLGDTAVAEYADAPGAHRAENTGSMPYQLFALENLRTAGWSSEPAVTGPNTTLGNESRAFRTYDVQLAGDKFQIRHVHTAPTLLLLVAGRVISEGGEVKSEDEPQLPSGLKQLEQPGQWVFLPAGEPHYVVRLAPDDVRVVEIEIR
jgi:quercetin dioxygenase-like cupin family protein